MMKKSLIALAVLGASGLAAAQSSVTLYGLGDIGVSSIRTPAPGFTDPNVDPNTGAARPWLDPVGRTVDNAWQNPLGVIGGNRTQATSTIVGPQDTSVAIPGSLQWDKTTKIRGNEMMNNAPSRVGLTGVEDIGNGTKVGFQFETHLDLEDGAADGTHWQRNANVFVGGGWGTVKVGRQLTVSHITEGAYDLTGLANYSVMRNTYGLNGFVPRSDSAIAYISPNFGGFTVAAAFASKKNLGTRSNVWDIGMMYNNGPIAVGAAVNNGLDNGKKNYHVGAKYSFGNFAVAASYHNGSSDGGITRADRGYWDAWGNPIVDVYGRRITSERIRRGYSIGGQAKFGAFTLTADVTRDTRNEWTGGWGWNNVIGDWVWNNKKYTNALFEAKYALSKRTFFYGAVLRLDGNTNWGLGMSHSF